MNDKILIYKEENAYGVFEIYKDYLKISYSDFGLNINEKKYKFEFQDIKSIELIIKSVPLLYNTLKIELKNQNIYNFYITKKNRTIWEGIILKINDSLVVEEKNNSDENKESIKNKLTKFTFGELYKKRIRFWIIIGAIITFLDRANYGFYNTGMFGVIGDMIVWGLIIGIPASLISSYIHGDFDDFLRPSKGKCPYCENEFIQKVDLGPKPIKLFCPNCSKELFIKDYYIYKYTEDMNKYFDDNTLINKDEISNKVDSNLESKNFNKYEELEKLKELLDKDIITEEEFNSKKKEILNLKD